MTAAPNPVAIGCVIPIFAWVEVRCQWGRQTKTTRPQIQHRTAMQRLIARRIPSQYRTYTLTPQMAIDRDILRQVHDGGDQYPFPFVPDSMDTEIALVRFAQVDTTETYQFYRDSFRDGTVEGQVTQDFVVEELVSGAPLTP